MSKFHFLPTVMTIIVVVVLDINNCNAGIVQNHDGIIRDGNRFDQSDLINRNKNPLNWVKKQVKKLKSEVGKTPKANTYRKICSLKKMRGVQTLSYKSNLLIIPI